MNQVPEKRKESVTKTLAIFGFVAIILFIVWLAVQIVSVIPSAFSSLASIADGVYSTQSNKTLTVATRNSVVNAGDSFTISWTEMRGEGTYHFSYACTDGVAVDVRKSSGNISAIACDTDLLLQEATSVEVLVTAEKQRFTDIPYTVSYTADHLDKAIKGTGVITIVNASIPTGIEIVEETETTEETQDDEEVATPAVTTPTLTAGKPVTIEKIIYKIPVSDPNGKVDLKITHLGVGTLHGKTFVRTSTIDQDEEGAIQFEITNIGTKTATSWSYVANLPSDIQYKSGKQVALKPNEKAVITLGFEGITRVGIEKFGAEVTAKGDVRESNNTYIWSVKVVD